MEIPRVMAKELYPAYAEEWIEAIVGLYSGYGNLGLYKDQRCFRSTSLLGISLAQASGTFDQPFPVNQIFPLIILLLRYVIVAINLYTVYGVCSREFQYNTLLAKWKEAKTEANADADVEPDASVDVFNLMAETDEPEELTDSFDENYTEASFMDYFFVIM